MAGFFGLGSVAYFVLFMINAVAVLNKERFLAPLGLTTSHFHQQQQQQAFNQGGGYNQGFDNYGMPQGSMGPPGGGEVSIKMRAVQLVDAVRTLMRSAYQSLPCLNLGDAH